MEGTIFSARKDSVEYIKFIGVIRYSQCAGLESHIEHLFSNIDFSEIIIDLEQTEMLDSTALGLLAKISIEYKKVSEQKIIIFMKQGELAHILKRVCFDQVFNIVNRSSQTDSSYKELPPLAQSEQEVLNSVIKAHKSLAEISPDNEHYFTDITKALAE